MLGDDPGVLLSYFSYLGFCVLVDEKDKNRYFHSAN